MLTATQDDYIFRFSNKIYRNRFNCFDFHIKIFTIFNDVTNLIEGICSKFLSLVHKSYGAHTAHRGNDFFSICIDRRIVAKYHRCVPIWHYG